MHGKDNCCQLKLIDKFKVLFRLDIFLALDHSNLKGKTTVILADRCNTSENMKYKMCCDCVNRIAIIIVKNKRSVISQCHIDSINHRTLSY